MVVGGALPGQRAEQPLHHRQRDSRPARRCREADARLAGCHPLLLGTQFDGKDGSHPGTAEYDLVHRSKAGSLSRPMRRVSRRSSTAACLARCSPSRQASGMSIPRAGRCSPWRTSNSPGSSCGCQAGSFTSRPRFASPPTGCAWRKSVRAIGSGRRRWCGMSADRLTIWLVLAAALASAGAAARYFEVQIPDGGRAEAEALTGGSIEKGRRDRHLWLRHLSYHPRVADGARTRRPAARRFGGAQLHRRYSAEHCRQSRRLDYPSDAHQSADGNAGNRNNRPGGA